MTAIVCGVMSAAPRPCTARATMSSSSVPESPQPSEASVKTDEPDEVDALRPEAVAEAPGDQQRHRVAEQVRAT